MALYSNSLVMKYEIENVDDPSKPKQASQKIRVNSNSTIAEMKTLADAISELIDTVSTKNFQEAVTRIQ